MNTQADGNGGLRSEAVIQIADAANYRALSRGFTQGHWFMAEREISQILASQYAMPIGAV